MGITFIDLSDIKGKDEYQANLGMKVYGKNGEKHVVEHGGVASHPGDAGMKIIADRIIEKLND